MSRYSLSLDLAGRAVVVIGAGTVAERRIRALLDAGAVVTVIAPVISPAIAALPVTLIEREYSTGDLAGARLVHAATDDPAVNAQVAADAEALNLWCVRADDAHASSAWTPATAQVDDISVAITSCDPRRSAALRSSIEAQLRTGDLPVKSRRSREHGHVVLIGGGPGDPDLITVRGRRELNRADVVVYDRLAPLALLASLEDDVELIDASKSPGDHVLTQDEINSVIIDRAQRGHRVVRLKGGDPFVLGRGSEEMLACIAAGVTVEVIPGVTSAISAPLAARIPVTHRGVSTGFIVISGHEVGDLRAAAQSELTVVVLMGVGRLTRLCAELIAGGRDASTPIAIIERAYAHDQRVTTGTLADITELAHTARVSNPAVIVIGEVVRVPELLTEAIPAALLQA